MKRKQYIFGILAGLYCCACTLDIPYENQFSDPEEQREVASLFHASLHLEGQEEARRAVLETVCRLKRDSIDWQNEHLAPTDLAGLQKIIEARKRLEDLERGRVTLHISFD